MALVETQLISSTTQCTQLLPVGCRFWRMILITCPVLQEITLIKISAAPTKRINIHLNLHFPVTNSHYLYYTTGLQELMGCQQIYGSDKKRSHKHVAGPPFL